MKKEKEKGESFDSSWNPSNPNLHSDFHRFMVHGPYNSHLLCVSSGNQIHLGWGGRWARSLSGAFE